MEPLEALVGQFLFLHRGKATGTLRVTGPSEQVKLFVLQQGYLADLDTGRADTVLEAALLGSGALGEKDVRKARKAVGRTSQTLGAALLELGLIAEEVAAEKIREQLISESCEVFLWPHAVSEFFEHAPGERLDGCRSELSELFEVLVDPEEIVLEAARKCGQWDIVTRHFGTLNDVVYATPGSFRYFHEQEHYPREYALLSKADGTKDIAELIDESGFDPFDALLVARRLQASGDLELINPVQMFQLGVECAAAGRNAKATKLFRRAHERGLDDFDLQLKLAQCLEAEGKNDEAIRRYVEFSDKCVSQLRTEDAVRSLRRAAKLDPGSLSLQERILELLIAQNRGPEAIEQGLMIAQRQNERRDPRAALNLLLRLRPLGARDVKLHQMIVELAEACGDHTKARTEREALAKSCDERKDVELALEMYQKMFCDGEDSAEVRLKLAHLHRQKGNRQKALDHINALLNLPEKKRIHEEEVVVNLHEIVRELRPSDLRSNRWLADHYARRGDKEKAVEVLSTWITHLESEGDLTEVVHAYELLVTVEDTYEHRWGLAKALEKSGKITECRRELRSLANLCLRKRELAASTRALDYILRTVPLDVETRKMQAELFEAKEAMDLAAMKHAEVALLSILAGNVQDAEAHYRRLPDDHPELPELVRRTGRLCQELGDRKKAVEQLAKAARLFLQHRDFGHSRLTVEELLAIEPGHLDATAILTEIKNKESPPPAPPREPTREQAAAPPAPVATATPSAPAPAKAPEKAKPVSPNLTFEREPFTDVKPIKANVTGIMARLKKLKRGPEVEAVNPKPLPTGDGTSEAPGSATTPAQAPAPTGAAAAGTSAQAALKSAASRLKALAQKKAQGAPAPAPAADPVEPLVSSLGPPVAAPAADASAGPAATDGATVSAAAPAQAPTAEPATSGNGTAPADPAAAADGSESPAREGAPVSAVKSMKLGGPASRLAALRKQKAT